MRDETIEPGAVLRRAGPPERLAGRPIVEDARLAEVLDPDAPLLRLHAGAIHLEGPAWQPSHDRLLVSDVPGRRLMAWHPDGRVEVVIPTTHFANGNAVMADGAVIHCEHGRRCLSRSDPDCAGDPVPIVTRYAGRRLTAPNDVVVAADGAIWFTDPIFGLVMPGEGSLRDPALDHRSVYRVDPVTGAPERMADFEQPNGLAFAPGGRTLYVSDTSFALGEAPGHAPGDRRRIEAFDVGTDGTLANRRVFYQPKHGVPDGFKVDARGWVWTGAADGVHIVAPDGERLGMIPTPSVVANLAFGGADGRRLFVCASTMLLAVDLR